ncbi:hypothetical protein MNB_SUP05-10-959 [hydrothermal vent metagenome]|jgi:hypothetical protein|uniref:WxL domain-containing protein n=1 Tax=hydrothermal vent metagenome TaxID=652676 RepID=A0A1W1DBF2_9ZZZZ
MKNTNTKYLLIASVAALLSSNVNAAVSTQTADNTTPTLSDSVLISFDHPQTIAVNTPENATGAASGAVSTTTWTITSNNAVAVNFTGTSPDATTGTQAFPQFSKQEVDASGVSITDRYDHLTTTYGIVIDGSDSIANEASRGGAAIKTWQTGATTAATPTQLVTAPGSAGSPFSHYGAIMPSDAGEFTMSLYSKGVGTQDTTQSGIYSTTLVAVITADEK